MRVNARGMAGLALHLQKMKPPKPRPSPPPSKTVLAVEKVTSESHAGTSSHEEVASQSLKNTFWV
jgi:hypothetical protein